MQAFSFSAQFAHESAMLKLPKERRRWGESKGGEGGREREFTVAQGATFKISFFASVLILRAETSDVVKRITALLCSIIIF